MSKRLINRAQCTVVHLHAMRRDKIHTPPPHDLLKHHRLDMAQYFQTHPLSQMPARRHDRFYPATGILSSAALSGRDDMEVSVYGTAERAVLVSRFDNLGKGASGAAIQNLNLVLGAREDEGLVRG